MPDQALDEESEVSNYLDRYLTSDTIVCAYLGCRKGEIPGFLRRGVVSRLFGLIPLMSFSLYVHRHYGSLCNCIAWLQYITSCHAVEMDSVPTPPH